MKKLLVLLVLASAAGSMFAWNNCGCAPRCCPKATVNEGPMPKCYHEVTRRVEDCPEKIVDISYTCPVDSIME